MTTPAIAFVSNTGVLDLLGLKSHIDDTFINSASVSFTVKDKAGADVTGIGITWPQTMDYVAASDGDYRGIMPAALALVPKQHYTAFIEADGGGERIGHWEFKFQAMTRTGEEV